MTSYPKNSNPLTGPDFKRAFREMMGDEPQPEVDYLMLDFDGPIAVSAIICFVHESQPEQLQENRFGLQTC